MRAAAVTAAVLLTVAAAGLGVVYWQLWSAQDTPAWVGDLIVKMAEPKC